MQLGSGFIGLAIAGGVAVGVALAQTWSAPSEPGVTTASAEVVSALPLGSGPPPGMFPADMPNVGDLWVEFCGVGDIFCEKVEVPVWGQVCTSDMADGAVHGPVRSTDGYKMAGHVPTPVSKHYAGWRCGENGELIRPDRGGYYDDGKFVEFKR